MPHGLCPRPVKDDLTVILYFHDLYNIDRISIYVVKSPDQTLTPRRVETQGKCVTNLSGSRILVMAETEMDLPLNDDASDGVDDMNYPLDIRKLSILGMDAGGTRSLLETTKTLLSVSRTLTALYHDLIIDDSR